MARLAATAVLLLSLLAVANCRVLETEPPETVVAISDEQSQANPAVPQETVAAQVIPCGPTVTVAVGLFLIPHPCRHAFLHRLPRWARHLRWARGHGLSHRRGAFPGPGDARVHPAVLSPEEPMEAALEAVVEQDIKKPPRGDGEKVVEEKEAKKPPRGNGEAALEAVAEPDPDTRPDHTDGEQIPLHGEEEDGEESELAKAWKGEMLRRFQGHGPHFHHSHHHHEQALEKDDSDDQEQQAKEVGAGGMHIKLFRRRFHHRHGDEEQDETATKHYFHHHHDSDNEVDEVEELARRLSRAIMRRSLSRGGVRHHHLHRHHAEEGGVRKWFRGLLNMNRF